MVNELIHVKEVTWHRIENAFLTNFNNNSYTGKINHIKIEADKQQEASDILPEIWKWKQQQVLLALLEAKF